jgi:SAM-dependent methyltransferase
VRANPAAFLERALVGLVEPEIDPDVLALLGREGPDATPVARLLELMSIYLDAHWGDLATPRPDGPAAPGSAGLVELLAARAAERVPAALELGASVGRGLLELARGAELTVGVDISLASLRRARRLLAGRPLDYGRRVAGRFYQTARVTPPAAAGPIALVCADALDPPLVPASFGRVAALNIVDVVHDPKQLLVVARTLCGPGGEILLGSPYNWQSGFVGEGHRLGEHDPAAEVKRRMTTEGCVLEDEAELPWALRRDARSAVAYRMHYTRFRKA